ncbi:hypothetical protein AB0K43_22365 [Kitasatospora sp. NPDC049258]|uniref:hypothetical protein n=1 Tax=Kitasatospora sp. NPDC049258 TaxID=3155394 RepID=UPI003431E03D
MGTAGHDGWVLWITTVVMVVSGAALALNTGGVAEKCFRLASRSWRPFGGATPGTLRRIGVGWALLGALPVLAELVRARAGG